MTSAIARPRPGTDSANTRTNKVPNNLGEKESSIVKKILAHLIRGSIKVRENSGRVAHTKQINPNDIEVNHTEWQKAVNEIAQLPESQIEIIVPYIAKLLLLETFSETDVYQGSFVNDGNLAAGLEEKFEEALETRRLCIKASKPELTAMQKYKILGDSGIDPNEYPLYTNRNSGGGIVEANPAVRLNRSHLKFLLEQDQN